MDNIFSFFSDKFGLGKLRHKDFERYLSPSNETGATTPEERAWCQWYAHKVFSGRGSIVEWGPWLGSLTRAYCKGLRQNKKSHKFKNIAHVYDLFVWENYCEDWAKESEHAGQLEIGTSFSDYYKKLCSEYLDYLNVYEADLTTQKWSQEPIEFIINDAVKTCEIGANVFREFMPSLLPKYGYVAHQDYLWPTEAFLQVFAYLARDYFDYEYTVPNSCMVIFRNVVQFETSAVASIESLDDITADLIEETFDWSQHTLAPDQADPRLLDLCRAITYWKCKMEEDARRTVRDSNLGKHGPCGRYNFIIDVLKVWGFAELLEAKP